MVLFVIAIAAVFAACNNRAEKSADGDALVGADSITAAPVDSSNASVDSAAAAIADSMKARARDHK